MKIPLLQINKITGYLVLLGLIALFTPAAQPVSALENLLIADAGIISDAGTDETEGSVAGTEPAVDGPQLPVLTLEMALETARSSNRNLLMAQQAVVLAHEAGRTSLAGFNPDLSFSFNYTRYAASQTIDLPEGETFELQAANNLRAELNFRYPIYQGGERSAAERVIAADMEVSRYQLYQAVGLIDTATVDAYCTAREGFGGLAVRQASYNSLHELERQAQALYDAGYMPLNDLLSVQVAVASAEQQVFEWTNNVQIRQTVLALALGVDVGSRWVLAPVDYPIVEIPFTIAILTDWALENRPEVHELRSEREKIEAQMDTIRATEGPNIDFRANFSESSTAFNFSDPSASLSGSISIWWDLYNFGRTDDLLAPLVAQLDLLDIQEEELHQQIRGEVEVVYYTLQNQYNNVQVSNRALGQAEEALRVATRRMEEGLAIMVEVLDAQSTWTTLGAATVYSSHGYYRVLALLSNAVGIPALDMIALLDAAGEETL